MGYIKTFYNLDQMDDIFAKSFEIWNQRKELFDYELDGLIFTPIYQQYVPAIQELHTYKWKPIITCDFRVEYVHELNFTFFHHGSENAKRVKTCNIFLCKIF